MADTIGRPMTPQDLTRIRFISDLQISPDGQRVAFVVTMLSEDKDQYLSNIWMVDTRGEPHRFTTGPRDTKPNWSPDGTRLAFSPSAKPHPKAQVYVMPAAGGAHRLTKLPNGVMQHVWSSDGSRLAIVARLAAGRNPPPRRNARNPSLCASSRRSSIRPPGRIYHDRRPHLFVVSAEGGEPQQQLTDGEFADTHPAWSPDGTQLAFVSARHEDRDYDNALGHLDHSPLTEVSHDVSLIPLVL